MNFLLLLALQGNFIRHLSKNKFIYDELSKVREKVNGGDGMEEIEEVFVVEAKKYFKDAKEVEIFESELKSKGFVVERRSIIFEY